ncbi:MAG: endolytic transglycosylase MltG [Actinomycetota bacterium]
MIRAFLALLIAIGLIAGGAFLYYTNLVAGPKGAGGPEVAVTIAEGSSATAIAEKLEQLRVVDSALAFRLYLRKNGISSDLRAGEYQLQAAQPFASLVEELKKGPPAEFVKLSIPEGLNLEQTAAQVERQTHIKGADFLAEATPAKVQPGILPTTGTTLEGFLYPSTYFVEETETAATLVARMIAEFDKQTGTALQDSAEVGQTPYEVLIIASLIEEEAKADDERAKISAVIHNRLKRNIPLGIDATIQYAVKKYEGQPLTVSDLAIDSPFNSRTRTGLPPNPLSSPRGSSVVAALNPASEDSIYYVLTADCVHHFFTADYNAFLRAKAQQPRNC